MKLPPEVERRRQEKRRKTCLLKYGTPTPAQSAKVRKKMERTCRERYGVATPFEMKSFNAKRTHTIRKRFGADHQMQSKDFVSQMEAKHFAIHGVSRPCQRIEVINKAQKSRYKRKKARISGILFKGQGYELGAVKALIRAGIDPSKITKPRKVFKYADGKVYLPDWRIRTPEKDTVYVEVKSTYTAGLTDKNLFRSMLEKSNALNGKAYWLLLIMDDNVGRIHSFSFAANKRRVKENVKKTEILSQKQKVNSLKSHWTFS